MPKRLLPKWLAVPAALALAVATAGGCGSARVDGTVLITPASASAPPLGRTTFSARGGSGDYTWSLATNASGGAIGAATGAYQAGPVGGVTDVVEVADAGGNRATATVAVTAGVAIRPATAAAPPRGSVLFEAVGGTGSGFTWSLLTNASGGQIEPSSGSYRAGAIPEVSDVVQVIDSLGNTATRAVAIGAGVTIAPATAAVSPRGGLTLSASGGSGAGFTWAFVTNGSGGTLDAASGAYLAGPAGDSTDVVQVTDPLGNTATRAITVGGVLRITPGVVGLAPRATQAFTASGGSNVGFTWAIATNGSGGSIDAATGAYAAGPASGLDVVRVTDSLGNTATAEVTVNQGVGITASAGTAPPRGQVTFSASGGSGAGYAWSLATNASGGSIGAATGLYTAGSTGGVTDVVRVTDSLGNTATHPVVVGPALVVAPAAASLAPRASQGFSASGGGTGRTWSMAANPSGGSIDPASGLYTAGATGGVTDQVRVVDSLGNAATAPVAVGAGVVIAPGSAALPPRGAQAFGAAGGSGTGYTWALATNASGGSIGPNTGLYTAGATGGVTDVVRVTDSLGNGATVEVAVGAAVVISPASATVSAGGGRTFSASGGSGTGYAWDFEARNSGGTIDAATGAYLSGPTSGVTDVVRVTDSLGNVATVQVIVRTALAVTPAAVTVASGGSQVFTASGGSGTGYAWDLAGTPSGGSIEATTGLYTAGPASGVTDVVRVTDSLGATATAQVTVGAALAISPGSATVAAGAGLAFTASGGSGTGFGWSLATNASGGSIDAATGAYLAGPSSGVADVVQVTDSLGRTATATVTVSGAVIQRWRAPTTWGGTAAGFWEAEPTLLQHATFGASGLPLEGGSAGATWSLAGPGAVPHPTFDAFAWPQVTRHGAGPFPATDSVAALDATRYRATGGDGALDLAGDLLVCAVVRPDFNPVESGYERVIVAKGTPGLDGWALVQQAYGFAFRYQAATGSATAFKRSHLPEVPRGSPLASNQTSYLVLCGGRSGDQIVIAANDFGATAQFGTLRPGDPLHAATTTRASIGGSADGTGSHRFGGVIYETGVWSEPATRGNVERRMGAVLGLGQVAGGWVNYLRNHEGPFMGVDGRPHTGWFHSPRLDPVKGVRFGMFGLNALIDETLDGGARPTALDRWTAAGAAAVVANVRAQPGDGLTPEADRISLPPGATLSTPLNAFTLPLEVLQVGPLASQIWVYLDTAAGDTTSGTLRLHTTAPDAVSGATVELGQVDVDLSTLASNQWNRIFSGGGLTTVGSLTGPATLSLENAGATPIQLTAWGLDVAQIGGVRGLPPGYDPGLHIFNTLLWTETIDQLALPQVPQSTAGHGFCVGVDAQPDDTLAWRATFDTARAAFFWWNGLTGAQERSVRLVIGGDSSHSIGQGKLISRIMVDGANIFLNGDTATAFEPGSLHNLKTCVSAAGIGQIYADDQPVGSPLPLPAGKPVPDLAEGYLTVGNEAAGDLPWYGFVRQALVCRFDGDPTACR